MYLSRGNRKLSKDVLIWNLPRLSACPGAGACKDWCYEIKIERMYKGTRPCRQQNLLDSKQRDFVSRMVGLLLKKSEKYVRVHECGDFYSQEYLDKWYDIARALPTKQFYAYTKSLHLKLWTHKPANFNILQSTGGKYDSRIGKSHPTYRTIGGAATLTKGEEWCRYGHGVTKCGLECTKCMNDSYVHIVTRIHK